MVCATSKASDQPVQKRSLIRAFASHLKILLTVKLLTEQHLGLLSLEEGCTCSSESTLVKMPHCWKSHATAHLSLLTLLHSDLPKLHNIYFGCSVCNRIKCYNFALDATKPVFSVNDKARQKPVSSDKETNFSCSKYYRYDTFQNANKEGTDQSVWMHKLVCTFVFHKPHHSDRFSCVIKVMIILCFR